MNKKSATTIIDSKHLKILGVKKDDLKNSVVFVCLDEDKYGVLDKAGLRKVVQQIDNIEPNGIYFPMTKRMDIAFYDVNELKNRDLIITVVHDDDSADFEEVEDEIKSAIPFAKSVTFIHKNVSIERR